MHRILSLLFCVIMLGIPGTSTAASLSVSPPGGTYSVGDQIALKVVVSSNDAPLNALSGVLSFPSGLFSVQSISKGGSILNFWVTEPIFSSGAGTVQFEGVSLSGFQGNAGTVLTIILRALKVGSGTVSFQSGQVLANDGQGTDITSGLSGGTFQIQAAKEKPTPVPTVVEEEAEPVTPTIQTLSAPFISLGREGGAPAVFGSSIHKNADVLLTFVPVVGSKLFITGVTSDEGVFMLLVPQALRNGPYAVNAVVVLRDGTKSNPSNILTVEVGDVSGVDISWENAAYAAFFLVILLLTLIGYLMSRRHFEPRKNISPEIKKEVKEAEDALHKSFEILEQDITGHMKNRVASGRIDSKEREDVANLKKDLKDAENYIDKEIKSINQARHLNEKE